MKPSFTGKTNEAGGPPPPPGASAPPPSLGRLTQITGQNPKAGARRRGLANKVDIFEKVKDPSKLTGVDIAKLQKFVTDNGENTARALGALKDISLNESTDLGLRQGIADFLKENNHLEAASDAFLSLATNFKMTAKDKFNYAVQIEATGYRDKACEAYLSIATTISDPGEKFASEQGKLDELRRNQGKIRIEAKEKLKSLGDTERLDKAQASLISHPPKMLNYPYEATGKQRNIYMKMLQAAAALREEGKVDEATRSTIDIVSDKSINFGVRFVAIKEVMDGFDPNTTKLTAKLTEAMKNFFDSDFDMSRYRSFDTNLELIANMKASSDPTIKSIGANLEKRLP